MRLRTPAKWRRTLIITCIRETGSEFGVTIAKLNKERLMFRKRLYLGLWLPLICCAVSLSAQQAVLAAANAVVPPVIKFSGVLTDASSKPMTGTVGVTFSLYKESQSGAPLWIETQNVTSIRLAITQSCSDLPLAKVFPPIHLRQVKPVGWVCKRKGKPNSHAHC